MVKPSGSLKAKRDWLRSPALLSVLTFCSGFTCALVALNVFRGKPAFALPTNLFPFVVGFTTMLVVLGVIIVVRRTLKSRELDAHHRA